MRLPLFCVCANDFFFRVENGDVFVDCALLSVVDCLQSPESSMLYLVQCPGPACMTMLSGIDELSGVRERKLTIELPDNLRVNWNPQVILSSSKSIAGLFANNNRICCLPPNHH